MANSARAGEPLEVFLFEDLPHQPHVHMAHERRIRPGSGHDARALLPPMLQGEEAVVGEDGGIRMAPR